jgi:Rap1a immunity proteins
MYFRCALTLIIVALSANSANGQADVWSANNVMMGCRTEASLDPALSLLQGVCLGAVGALAALPNRTIGYCVPKEVKVDEALRVAMAYIDRIPSRTKEPFNALVAEAFKANWPCQ